FSCTVTRPLDVLSARRASRGRLPRLSRATGPGKVQSGRRNTNGNPDWQVGLDQAICHAMKVDLFDFELPEERIALRPAEPRDAAGMLVVRPGEPFEDRHARELPELLDPGDVLVFNDTKVIPAQLVGIRRRGDNAAEIDATLHMRIAP